MFEWYVISDYDYIEKQTESWSNAYTKLIGK